MTICPTCGKPYCNPIANFTLTIPSTVVPDGYCNGIHVTLYISNTTVPLPPVQSFTVMPTTFSFSGQFDLANSFKERLDDELIQRIQQEPEEAQPLEWSEVEQQLDAFMAELNGRNA